MNTFLHRSEDRGHVEAGWLNTRHSFSFGSWYNPKLMGFGPLRVINDDHIAAHNGFGTHGHDNMEILTCVLSGAISHKDSMGNAGDIKAGEWQLMSAGTGVRHSEINQYDQDVHLLQIWIIPNEQNALPTYQQIQLDLHDAPNQWHVIAGPNSNAQMHLRQDAEVKTAVIHEGLELPIELTKKFNYVHVIEGEIEIAGQIVKPGDAYMFDESSKLKALSQAQVIWFDLPA